MSAKQARMGFRLDADQKERIERAAALTRQSASAFVVGAAVDAADLVLSHADVTIMPAEQFDELMAALDVADEAPALAKLASEPRRYVRG